MTDLVASRAHRILRHLASYSDVANNADGTRSTSEQLRLETDERLLGWYGRSSGEPPDVFAVTTKGLRICNGNTFRLIGYEQILSAVAPGPKIDVDHVTLELADGTAVDLPVKGGPGHLRDAWEVLRFLRRVTEDLRKVTLNTA
jgi:hypothetical protein